jgi:hypothetical protein
LSPAIEDHRLPEEELSRPQSVDMEIVLPEPTGGTMKDDGREGNQQPQASHTENSDATGKPVTNANEHQTEEPRLDSGAEASGKPTVSSRKVEANRRNARRSTGPKTTSGKKRVSRNAIKHGFYSKWLLVEDLAGKESQREYADFHADIFKHYQPVGWLEERWVEMIAVWSWRLRRVIRHESGQIAQALAEHRYDLQQSRAADAQEEPEFIPSSSPEMDALTDHLLLPTEGIENRLRHEALINRQLNHALTELERQQERRKGGPQSE